MKRQRKQYSADLKAKIAVEAVKGQRTMQEIASHYGIHPNQVTHWKKQLLDGASEVFSNGRNPTRARKKLRAFKGLRAIGPGQLPVLPLALRGVSTP